MKKMFSFVFVIIALMTIMLSFPAFSQKKKQEGKCFVCVEEIGQNSQFENFKNHIQKKDIRRDDCDRDYYKSPANFVIENNMANISKMDHTRINLLSHNLISITNCQQIINNNNYPLLC